MFERGLTRTERELLRRIESFIRRKHRDEGGHDASHVLAVTRYAIRIAEGIEQEVNPFILIAGALFHDLGRVGEESGILHGVEGAALVRSWLGSTWVTPTDREKILRIVARHTPTTMIPPETVEEQVVYDADALDRLGVMGMLRGLMGKRGSTDAILEDRMQKRMGDYDRLHFSVSRRIGRDLHRDTLEIVARFRAALVAEARELEEIPWPVPADTDLDVPSVPHAARLEREPDLSRAIARVEEEELRMGSGVGAGSGAENASGGSSGSAPGGASGRGDGRRDGSGDG